MSDLAAYIEHTLLKPEAGLDDIARLCDEAIEHHFVGVCINGCWVSEAKTRLEDSGIRVVTVVGFPLGAVESDVKRFETEAAVDSGADEIDMVINVAMLRANNDAYLIREMRDVVEAADNRPVKVILETCLLSDEEKRHACDLVVEAGAKFVKTSTGFSKGGATTDDVQLMRSIVGTRFGVKASGGIRDAAAARAMIEAGANRLGTSSGVAIITAGQGGVFDY